MKLKKFVFTSAAALTLFSTGAALASAQNSTSTVQAATTKKKVMHNSYYYKKDGKTIVKNSKGKKKMAKSYQSVKVSKKVTINGSKFYKISGKNEYIKAGAIDGTKRTLTHNAYIYTSKGKSSKTLKKGKTVTTYGSAFTINGKSMYRIASGEYVVVGNFKKKASTPEKKPTKTNTNTNTNTSTSTNTNNTSDELMKKYQSWIDNANKGALVAIRDTKEYNDDGPNISIAKGDFYTLPDPTDNDDVYSDYNNYADVYKDKDGKYYIEIIGPDGSGIVPAADFTFSTSYNTYKESSEYKNLVNKYVYDDNYIGAKVTLSSPVKSDDGKISYSAGDTIEIENPDITFNSYGNYSISAFVPEDSASIYIPISSIASYTPFK